MRNRHEEPLTVAVIGCGRVAEDHLKAVRHLHRRLRLCGVADTVPEQGRALLARTGFPDDIPVYEDHRVLLDAQHPDIVAVTTPSGTHVGIGGDVLAAGAHLVVEKPMTLSLSEADQLLAAASQAGRRIAVGHKFRYVPLMRQLRDQLKDGLIGDRLQGSVSISWGHDQAYYDQAAWRGTWTMDGGALMNQSIHGLDLLLWLMDSPVTAASGRLARRAHRMEAEDVGGAVLELASGALCMVQGTTNTPPDRHEAVITVTGTRGTITAGIRAGRPLLSVRDGRGRSRTFRFLRQAIGGMRRAGHLSNLLRLAAPHTLLYADLLDALAQDRAPLADGESGRAAVEAVLAVYRSALLRRDVTLPLEAFTLEQMKRLFDPEEH